jgi:hypothetical protein
LTGIVAASADGQKLRANSKILECESGYWQNGVREGSFFLSPAGKHPFLLFKKKRNPV